MARIIVNQNQQPPTTPNQNTPDPDAEPKMTAGQKFGKFFSDYLMALVAMVIALVVYLVIRSVIPDGIAWWAKEIWALVISLLFLWGFSAATKSHHKGIPAAVVLFILALFVYFMISGYSKYEGGKEDDKKSAELQNVIDVPVLDVGTHTFFLENIGDETGWFQYPDGANYSGRISSQDYGYTIYYSDKTSYKGGMKTKIPEKPHGILKVVADKPNQYVRVVVHTY